jgi:hypothetical protein
MDLLEEEGTILRHEQDKAGGMPDEDQGIADENGNSEESG